MDGALAALHREAFYVERHRIIFDVARDLQTTGQTPGLIVVTDCLRERGHLAAVGGAAYVTSLLDATPTPAMLSSHVAIVVRDWRKRLLADLGANLHHAALPALHYALCKVDGRK